MSRPDFRQEKMKDHHVEAWDGMTACGRDSIIEDLNQVLDEDLVTCKRCLDKLKLGKRKGKR
jgi:hypothetical protein